MTFKSFCIVLFVASICLGVSGKSFGQDAAAALPAVEVAKIKAQEFSRALAQLKIQEIALQQTTPPDAKALGLNHAQQAALDQELTKLATVPANAELKRLESERNDLSEYYRPMHPKMIALQKEIEQAKAALAANQ